MLRLSRLGKASLVSLTLHGLIMFGLSRAIDDTRVLMAPQHTLQAVVARHAPAVVPAAMAPPATPVPKLTAKRPVPVREQIHTAKAEPVQPISAVVAATGTLVGSAAPASVGTTAREPAPNPAATGLVTEPRAGYDGEDLRQYKLAVAAQARRFKRYPALARERGWEGTSEVAVSLLSETPWPAVTLAKSSGFSALDEQAVEMIRQASRAALVPAGLQQRGVRFVLPVTFSLDD